MHWESSFVCRSKSNQHTKTVRIYLPLYSGVHVFSNFSCLSIFNCINHSPDLSAWGFVWESAVHRFSLHIRFLTPKWIFVSLSSCVPVKLKGPRTSPMTHDPVGLFGYDRYIGVTVYAVVISRNKVRNLCQTSCLWTLSLRLKFERWNQ